MIPQRERKIREDYIRLGQRSTDGFRGDHGHLLLSEECRQDPVPGAAQKEPSSTAPSNARSPRHPTRQGLPPSPADRAAARRANPTGAGSASSPRRRERPRSHPAAAARPLPPRGGGESGPSARCAHSNPAAGREEDEEEEEGAARKAGSRPRLLQGPAMPPAAAAPPPPPAGETGSPALLLPASRPRGLGAAPAAPHAPLWRPRAVSAAPQRHVSRVGREGKGPRAGAQRGGVGRGPRSLGAGSHGLFCPTSPARDAGLRRHPRETPKLLGIRPSTAPGGVASACSAARLGLAASPRPRQLLPRRAAWGGGCSCVTQILGKPELRLSPLGSVVAVAGAEPPCGAWPRCLCSCSSPQGGGRQRPLCWQALTFVFLLD